MDKMLIALGVLLVVQVAGVFTMAVINEPCRDTRIINGRECVVFEDKLHGAPIYAVFCGDEPVRITRDWMKV